MSLIHENASKVKYTAVILCVHVITQITHHFRFNSTLFAGMYFFPLHWKFMQLFLFANMLPVSDALNPSNARNILYF